MALIDFPSSPSLNDEYTFEGRTWLWNGTGWEVKAFVAPPGATGATGVAGATGPAGVTGATGAVGATGATGPQGDSGAVGATGATGPVGVSGATGATGVAGTDGATGATGPQGDAGAVGATGATGVQGPAGATGATGVQGPAGVTGATGPQGDAGAVGATGVVGVSGATGATGPVGVTGATGVQGVQGDTGATGVVGVSGATGATGVVGVTGATGVQGPVGVTGATGVVGVTGATGVQGPSGPTGATGPVGVTGATGATPAVGGSNTQVLFNDSGVIGGDAGLTYDKTTDALTVTGNIQTASINSGQLAGFRNKIINGAMEVSQRGTSFAAVANNTYTLDRFAWQQVGTMAVTINQSTDVPDNTFQNSLHVDVTTADTSLAGSDYAFISHKVEGYDVRDLIGKTFTLSFWVKSSKTGTHCISFRNSGVDRAYVMTYSVSVANTWEFKSLTLSSGLITDGTWNWTTGIGLSISFVLAVGSTFQTTANAWQTGNFLGTSAQVNVMDNAVNNFYITGIQLEVGNVATPFERVPACIEMSMCERYYKAGSAVRTAGTQALVYFSTYMRATPIVSVTTVFGSTVSVSGGNYTSFDGFRATVASGGGDFTWTASAEL